MRFTIGLLLLACAAWCQNSHSVTLTWTDTRNPTGTTYTVYRATGLCSGTPVYAKLAATVADKTYVDATVTPGNYCYTVTAVYGGMESAPSNAALAPVPSWPVTQLTVAVQ